MATRNPRNNTAADASHSTSAYRSQSGTHDSGTVLDLNEEFRSDAYERHHSEASHAGTSHKKKRKKKKSKAPLIIILVIVALLVGIYVIIALNGRNHFLPNTFIRGQEVSWLTAAETNEKLIPDNSHFLIKKIDGEETIEFSDFDYVIELTTPAEELIASQNIWAWPLRLFSSKVYENETTISYDKAALRTEINNLEMFKSENITKCKNAYIKLGEDGHYSIVPEVTGNELKKSKTISAIKQAVADGLFEIDLVEKDLYKKPTVLSTDEKLNKTLSEYLIVGEEVITIDLEGGVTTTLTTPDVLKFVTIEGTDFYVNEEYLASYMDELSEKYDTYMKPRNFKTHSGTTLKVGGSILEGVDGDNYGYLMDKETSTDILRSAIYACQTQTISLVWDMVGNTRDKFNGDIGDTYIEISITDQHMWYYKDGAVAFETDVVTGLGSYEKRQTPEGVFCAVYKDENVTLTGAMDGAQWKTVVAYWISVTYTGVGIHDATWQPVFGGDWYMYNGSHGCINTPYDAMATLYDMVELYTPIVIYSFSDEHVNSEGSHATVSMYKNEEYIEETTTAETTTAETTTAAETKKQKETETETESTTEPETEPTTEPETEPTTEPETESTDEE